MLFGSHQIFHSLSVICIFDFLYFVLFILLFHYIQLSCFLLKITNLFSKTFNFIPIRGELFGSTVLLFRDQLIIQLSLLFFFLKLEFSKCFHLFYLFSIDNTAGFFFFMFMEPKPGAIISTVGVDFLIIEAGIRLMQKLIVSLTLITSIRFQWINSITGPNILFAHFVSNLAFEIVQYFV